MRISDWSSDVCSSDLGMDKVVKTAKTMGLGEYPSVLAISLGAGETTVLKLVNAYSMMVNGGKQLAPTLIDLVQNRHGKIIYRREPRPCEGCKDRTSNRLNSSLYSPTRLSPSALQK